MNDAAKVRAIRTARAAGKSIRPLALFHSGGARGRSTRRSSGRVGFWRDRAPLCGEARIIAHEYGVDIGTVSTEPVVLLTLERLRRAMDEARE